jgi:hypothetical protein
MDGGGKYRAGIRVNHHRGVPEASGLDKHPRKVPARRGQRLDHLLGTRPMESETQCHIDSLGACMENMMIACIRFEIMYFFIPFDLYERFKLTHCRERPCRHCSNLVADMAPDERSHVLPMLALPGPVCVRQLQHISITSIMYFSITSHSLVGSFLLGEYLIVRPE